MLNACKWLVEVLLYYLLIDWVMHTSVGLRYSSIIYWLNDVKCVQVLGWGIPLLLCLLREPRHTQLPHKLPGVVVTPVEGQKDRYSIPKVQLFKVLIGQTKYSWTPKLNIAGKYQHDPKKISMNKSYILYSIENSSYKNIMKHLIVTYFLETTGSKMISMFSI